MAQRIRSRLPVLTWAGYIQLAISRASSTSAGKAGAVQACAGPQASVTLLHFKTATVDN